MSGFILGPLAMETRKSPGGRTNLKLRSGCIDSNSIVRALWGILALATTLEPPSPTLEVEILIFVMPSAFLAPPS